MTFFETVFIIFLRTRWQCDQMFEYKLIHSGQTAGGGKSTNDPEFNAVLEKDFWYIIKYFLQS